MKVTVQDILEVLLSLAPLEYAEAWDNVGLIVGEARQPVHKILGALDLTPEVARQAADAGAELIITHHPPLFRAVKSIKFGSPEADSLRTLIQHGISVVSLHTNLDRAEGGISDNLAQILGIRDHQAAGTYLRVGEIEPVSAEEYARHAQRTLGDVVRLYGDGARVLGRVAVMGGSGGEFWKEAQGAGAQGFLVGEISYHMALEAAQCGLSVFEAGHGATERGPLRKFVLGLQERLDGLQYSVKVLFESVSGSQWPNLEG